MILLSAGSLLRTVKSEQLQFVALFDVTADLHRLLRWKAAGLVY
jgi:hypothetical protein